MKNFHHWILTSIAIAGLVITSTLFTQAQQTTEGEIQLEIQAGNSCCVYGTSVVFGGKDISFGITEFSGDFLSYNGTNTWGCVDMLGTETGRAMYIQMSGDMENQNGNKINSGNVKISFDDTTLIGGDCQYTVNGGIDVSLNTGVTLVEKAEIAGNYGKICELGTTNVELKVVTNTGQAPGNYQGTLVIDLPSFANGTCDAELIGTFYDAETDGLAYIGNMGSVGVTSNSGSFSYKPGEQITFKVGTVTLGNPVIPSANGSVFVTDLFGVARTEITDPNVIEIGRLLQGLDTDNNPENGIVIESSIASQFTENNNVTALDVSAKLTALSKPIKTAKQVVQHLEKTAEEKLSEDVNIGYSSVEIIPGGSYEEPQIVIDSGNNTYIAGTFEHENALAGMVSFGSIELYNNGQSRDGYIGKKNVSGDWIWVKKYGSDSSDNPNSVKIDAMGNIYIGGSVGGSFGGTGVFGQIVLSGVVANELGWYKEHPFVAKLDNDGNWLWVTTGGYEISAIEVDQVGNSYVVGNYYSTGTFGSIVFPSEGEYTSSLFIGKIDSNGNWLWVKKMDTSAGIRIDTQGNIYVIGSFGGSGTFGTTILTSVAHSTFVAKISSSGDWLRATQSQTSTDVNCSSSLNSSAIDQQGNIYLLGTLGSYCEDPIYFGDTMLTGDVAGYTSFIAKMDSNGNRVTAKKGIGGVGLAIDKNGFIYTTASFDGSISLGSAQLTNRWSSFSYNDIVGYVVKLNQSLEPVSANLYEGMGVSSIVADSSDDVYLIGTMSDVNLSLGDAVLTGARNSSLLYKMPFRDKESILFYQTTPPERAN
ncbi:hypothetical protein P148_SR1C00001G0112 [candidate division SR1 bacterium RAAC1_SR1_1]|nr:hypothetical protein P148_SR1C00001G0112 [candidate division SR1 bacterium RAAC1_SR1_1]